MLLLLTVGTLFLALTAGIALAADIACSGGTCTGTPKADAMTGSEGDDYMDGLGGDDKMIGDVGSDRIYGSRGNDTIDAADGAADYVNCGDGRDTAQVDSGDTVVNCEWVNGKSVS